MYNDFEISKNIKFKNLKKYNFIFRNSLKN